MAGTGTAGSANNSTPLTSTFNSPYFMAFDSLGDLFIACSGDGTVRKITPGGTVSTFASGLNNPTGIAVDGSNNVYVAESNSYCIDKITPGGVKTVYAGVSGSSGHQDGSGSTALFDNLQGLLYNGLGNLYVVDCYDQTIREINLSTSQVSTIAGSNGVSGSANGAELTAAQFSYPTAVALDPTKTILYVADQGNNEIRAINLSTGMVSTLAGSTTAGNANGTGATASFNNPLTLVTDASGTIYVGDQHNHIIREITAAGVVSTIAGSSTSGSTDGNGTGASFNTPNGLAFSSAGDLYVSDQTANKLRKLEVYGYTITPTLPTGLSFDGTTGTVSGTPTASSAATNYMVNADNSDGNASAIVSIAVLSSNANLSALTSSSGALNPAFVSGTTAYTAPDITAESVTITPTLQDTTATLTINGTAATSGTATPVALSAGSNTITVAVTAADGTTVNNYTIAITRIIPAVPSISYTGPQVYPTGTAISPLTPTGSGVAAFAYGVGTTTITTALNSPTGIATDASGNLFVANIGDGTIYKLTGGTGTPAAFSAGFNTPFNITTDATGNVYVADVGNAAIEEIPSAGGALVPFATGSIGATGVAVDAQGNVYATNTVTTSLYKIPVGGTVTTLSSSFSNPYDVAADNKGNLYVADNNSGTGTIDKFSTSGTSAGSVGSGFQYPSSVITDNQGNVYVADASSVKMVPAGGGSTVTLASGFSGLFGIALGQAGAIYVTDNAATAVEKLNPVGGYYISPALSAGLVFNNTTGVISGTPTTVSPATTYTITGYNSGGGTSSTVSIQVTPPSALLSALTLSSGTLSPAFTSAGTSYTASVPNTTSTITVTPTTQDPAATVTVNGNSPTTPVNLNVGPNSIAVLVTASDGVTKKTYTVTVTVAAPSYSTLSNFSFSVGTHPPVFVPGQTSYADTLNTSVTSVAITPYATSPTATVTINGVAVTSGSPSQPIALFEGQTSTATIVVTAAGGSSQTTYTVTIYRLPSTNAHLSFLSVKGVPLSPVFAGTTTGYTASVTNATSSVTLIPTVADANATVMVNGVAVASGTASQSIPLIVGSNTINTIVTSQGGTTLTYTVVITRGPSAIATLSNLTLSRGGLSPGFGPSKTSYTTLVGETVTSITETPTVTDPTATITVNGTALTSGTATNPILLNIGANVITTVVTAQDGSTIDTYTVTVTRQPSSNAKLGFLGLSHVVLSPAFAVATTGYTASVSNSLTSTNVLPILVDTTARIAVNGIAVASGASTPVTLIVGTNVINTVVTAQDGVTQITYTVTVTRAAPPSAAYVTYEPVSVEKPTDGPQLVDDGIVVHQGVSPNGDGIDDYLQIDGITNYPDNKLTIINRSGMLVYETKGYDNSSRLFDGHSNKNGQMQLPGTYFYSLDYTANGVIKHMTGYIVLKY